MPQHGVWFRVWGMGWGGRRAIARCPCTPQGPMEARGEKINVSSDPSKEIAGLKKMMMMMMKMKMIPQGEK